MLYNASSCGLTSLPWCLLPFEQCLWRCTAFRQQVGGCHAALLSSWLLTLHSSWCGNAANTTGNQSVLVVPCPFKVPHPTTQLAQLTGFPPSPLLHTFRGRSTTMTPLPRLLHTSAGPGLAGAVQGGPPRHPGAVEPVPAVGGAGACTCCIVNASSVHAGGGVQLP